MRPFGDSDDLLTLCAVCSEYLDSQVSKSSLAESLSCMNRNFNPNLQYLPTAVHIHVEKEMEGAVSSCGACLPGTYISCNHDGMSVGEQPIPQPPPISPNSLVQHQLQSNCCQHRGNNPLPTDNQREIIHHQHHSWQLHPKGWSVRLAPTLPYSVDSRQRFMTTPVSSTRQKAPCARSSDQGKSSERQWLTQYPY